MKRLFILISLCAALLLLAGCTTKTASTVPMDYRWANVEGSQLDESKAGEQFYFNILIDQGMVAEGAPIKIKVSGNVTSGSLRFELRQPNGQAVWNSGTIGPGDFSIASEYPLTETQPGTYTLGMVYGDQTTATYNLGWHALKLGPAVLLPGAGMILVALAFVIYAVVRRQLSWRYLLLGALFWILTVAVKFAFAIPVNPLVYQLLNLSYENIYSPGNLVAYVYVGSLTGIFEAGLAWLILRKVRWGRATWNQALIFGIGFGAVEALLLGVLGLISASAGLLAPEALPVYTLGALAHNTNLLMASAPIAERLSVIFAHIFACVLIFYAIASGEAKWAWLSILYKTLLDTPAAFAAFWGINNDLQKLWTIEAVVAIFGLIGLLGTIWLARRYPQAQAASPEEQPAALPA